MVPEADWNSALGGQLQRLVRRRACSALLTAKERAVGDCAEDRDEKASDADGASHLIAPSLLLIARNTLQPRFVARGVENAPELLRNSGHRHRLGFRRLTDWAFSCRTPCTPHGQPAAAPPVGGDYHAHAAGRGPANCAGAAAGQLQRLVMPQPRGPAPKAQLCQRHRPRR